MGAVTLRGLRKRYGAVEVIRGLDLEVRDGEFMVFVGPSGCGKSTTLRMIAGLESISEGELLIDGERANERHPAERGTAMVFQSYALYPHMTVAENMGFALRMAGVGRAERTRQVGRAAEILHITELLERYPRQLSGGQRQRVAIGRAIVRKPKVFLFDEPLSNLDAELRVTMRIELGKLHRELGTTMIYVTHDQVEAMTLGERIVVMDRGVIQQIDAPMTLYQRPANLFVAGFLGAPAMNQFRGRVRDDGAAVQGDEIALPIPPAPALRGREVVVGVRPEDLQRTDGASPPGGATLQVTVELVEAIGNEAFIHARLGSWTLIARSPPQQLPPNGATISLAIGPGRAHFFDAHSGARIETPG
jgi:multiple sugar transport system ATP-binding protein